MSKSQEPEGILSPQEMLDRAVRGLRAQGFKRSMRNQFEGDNACAYGSADGCRCAWGHVDPSVAPNAGGGVYSLAISGYGVARHLDDDGLEFARRLQQAHDSGYTPDVMEKNLRKHAEHYGLIYPETES